MLRILAACIPQEGKDTSSGERAYDVLFVIDNSSSMTEESIGPRTGYRIVSRRTLSSRPTFIWC
jgi:hypothetical protein